MSATSVPDRSGNAISDTNRLMVSYLLEFRWLLFQWWLPKPCSPWNSGLPECLHVAEIVFQNENGLHSSPSTLSGRTGPYTVLCIFSTERIYFSAPTSVDAHKGAGGGLIGR